MDNGVTPDMIKRFLDNRSDEAEAALVSEYLKSNPHILEGYSNDDDAWQEGNGKHLPLELREEMWENVAKKMNVSKRVRYGWLVAASMAGIALAACFFFSQNQKESVAPDAQSVAAAQHKKVIENNSHTDKVAVLPDGTRVILKYQAVVYYYDTFTAHRNIYLQGVALFKVVHDAAHPFTVYANGIATTDLGTRFWIASTGKASVTVRLLEGSVVVHSAEKGFTMKDVFLSPGEKVVINKKTGTATVSAIWKNEIKKRPAAVKKKESKSSTVWTNSAYTFSKASLAKVFNRIALQYHVQIKLADSSIGYYQFTGKIMYKDSLGTIMTAICEMNNLAYSRSGNVISIKKK